MRSRRSTILVPGDPRFEEVAQKIKVAIVENRIISSGDLSTVNNLVEPPSGPLLIDLDPDPGFRREWDVKFPVRTDLEVLGADSPKQSTIGWKVSEKIGIGAFNLRGVSRMKIETVPCPICGEKVPDLHTHANKIDDVDHGVLSVMTS